MTLSSLSIVEELPRYAERLSQALYKGRITPSKANHLLLSDYSSDSGIMPHTNGPAYSPFVPVLSLGSPCVIRLTSLHPGKSPTTSLLLWPRSLYVFSGHGYAHVLRSIDESAYEEVLLDIQAKDGNSIKGSSACNAHLTPLNQTIAANGFEPIPGLQPMSDRLPYTHSYLVKRGPRVSFTLRWVQPLLFKSNEWSFGTRVGA